MEYPTTRSTIWQLFAKDILQYVREPTAAFFTFAFPGLLFVILGSVYGSFEIPGEALSETLAGVTLRSIDIMYPGFVGFVIANLCIMSVPNFLAYQRESGYFRAIQVSPVSLVTVILVRILVYGTTFVFSYGLLYLLARILFRVQFWGHFGPYLMGVVICFVALGGVGFLLGGLFRSPQTTQALASVLFFVLYFTSGSAFPREDFPQWLYRITEFNPLAHVTDMLVDLWLGRPVEHWWISGLVVVGVGAVCILLIPVTFQWDATSR